MEEDEIEVTPSSRSVFRTLLPNWRESRVSLGLSISSRSLTTVLSAISYPLGTHKQGSQPETPHQIMWTEVRQIL
jgi:hypothetical protein